MLMDTQKTSGGVPDVYRVEGRSKPALPRFRTPTLSVGQRGYHPVRRGVELILALFLGLPALPVIAGAALFVRLTSRGPAFYTQRRVGRGGKVFTIYKLRTMIHNCESL